MFEYVMAFTSVPYEWGESVYRLLNTVESLNKGHFRTSSLSFVRKMSSWEVEKCIESIGRKYSRASRRVLCREVVLILECPQYQRFHCTLQKHSVTGHSRVQSKIGDHLLTHTVKRALRTTCTQRAPVQNDHHIGQLVVLKYIVT